MQTINNVHQQFASFFDSNVLQPFAYLVSKKLGEGHICLDLDNLGDDTALQLSNTAAYNAEALRNDRLVGTSTSSRQPFVLHRNKLYLHRYFTYETTILNKIKEWTRPDPQVAERAGKLQQHANLIAHLFGPTTTADGVNWQLVAAILAVLQRFTIITGGPGTGKTTTVAKILSLLYTQIPDLKVGLAAPTGKAAVRMAESLKAASFAMSDEVKTSIENLIPSTIHRLLKTIPHSPYFKHNQSNPLPYDVLIIDESSMIDVALFAKLFDAVGSNTRLILLGDKDQLASVEAGSLFGDLCRSLPQLNTFSDQKARLINAVISQPNLHLQETHISGSSAHPLFEHIIELKKSHRFSDEKGIGKLSKAIINNDVPALEAFIDKPRSGEVEIDTEYKPEIFEAFIAGYADYIQEPDIQIALQKLNNLRVLCAIREGQHGLHQLNLAIESHLRKLKLLEKTGDFYNNRPIIITKNYYDLNLFNGDVGIIRPDEKGRLKAWFENGKKELMPGILPGYISDAETVFAMTVHKSQGSEYGKVLMVLPNQPDIPVLTRELLYTGVTRAKSKVIIQGSPAVIMQTAERVVQRASGILDRFSE